MIADPNELQRLRPIPGQDLLSRDLRDQAGYEEQLRWWHNRALHGAFGVRSGLRVAATPAAATAPSVTVAPGLAYDASGRELILPAPRTLPLPAGPGTSGPRVLVIRHREGVGSPSRGDSAGVCRGGGALPRGADLAWLPAPRLRPPDGVPLARVAYDGDDPFVDPGFRPPVARPLARPLLGRGSTVRGGTAWERWDVGGRRFLLGLEVPIDTRAAGFTELPCYFAWLTGGVEIGLGSDGPSFLLPLSPHLAAASPTGFRCRVLTFAFGGTDGRAATGNHILAAARRQLSVCWLGIQMRRGDDALHEVDHGHP